jgi:hypothetical protein
MDVTEFPFHSLLPSRGKEMREASEQPRTLDIAAKDQDQDDHCEVCSSIPWDAFTSASASPLQEVPLFHSTAQDMEKSTCRVCRLLGMIIVARDLSFFPSKPPYRLKVLQNISNHVRSISTVNIRDHASGSISLPWTEPHILVVQEKVQLTDHALRVQMMGGLPLELIRSSIDTCQSTHGHYCTPKNPDLLRGLKVIDCIRQKVVSAPVGCQYVALSYVWGPGQADQKVPTGFNMEETPRTVRDSCLVAQSLGYDYLWVNRYVSS